MSSFRVVKNIVKMKNMLAVEALTYLMARLRVM